MKHLLKYFWIGTFTLAYGQEAPDIRGDLHPSIRFFPLRVTIKVVDEYGKPVEGADVDVGIPNARYKDQLNNFRGKSAADGKFSAESLANGSTLPIVVKKDGCYISRLDYEEIDNNPEAANKAGRFEPWDPTVEVVLKKIGKPIPMLVRISHQGIAVPSTGDELLFDLMTWDWLPPHGKGKIADLAITVNLTKSKLEKEDPEDDDVFRASMKIRFKNEHDGYIPIKDVIGPESELQFPRAAPETGYDIRELQITEEIPNEKAYENREKLPKGYFFRIRTEANATGKVVSANYGMIVRKDLESGGLPAIDVYGLKNGITKPGIIFSESYFNPNPGDRNLEYDRRTNLSPE